MKKLGLLATSICLVLAFAFLPFARIGTAFAEETDKLTVSTLQDISEQEITSSIKTSDFVTDFGDELGSATKGTWTTPTYPGNVISDVNSGDLTSSGLIGYDDTTKFSDLGTDSESNKYGLVFMLKDKGVAGIESPTFTVPANAYYVLTFNVKICKLANSGSQIGLNAKIIDGESVYSMDAIKKVSNEYATYAFLIQGNEYQEKSLKLQLLFGNATKNSETDSTLQEQIGYVAVDTIRFYSVTYSQFDELRDDSTMVKEVSLLSQNSNYIYIDNGYFNISNNQIWDLGSSTKLSDFQPLNWTQTGSANTDYGIINTYSSLFTARTTAIGLAGTINPGNPDGISSYETNNNVLMLYNATAGYQTIKSSNIVLAKNGYYEISFKFNTPYTTNETNKLSFYLTDTSGKTIYAQEDVLSYTESNIANNEWTQFHVFIKTKSDTAQTLNLTIKFGSEKSQSTGIAYIDEVRLVTKSSSSAMMINDKENNYVLKTDGEETEYLKTGTISFEELEKLDSTNVANRSLAVYNYDQSITEIENNEEEEKTESEATTGNGGNISTLTYVLPSVAFGACLIGGVSYFYIRKIKLPKPKRKSKVSYDRKKTLEKQIKNREDENKKNEKLKNLNVKNSLKKQKLKIKKNKDTKEDEEKQISEVIENSSNENQ